MKRQYILPSCSLTLEGIGTDPTQAMSILANAECQFMGIDQRLSGGLEFFQALVESVSRYSQGVLGGSPRATPEEKLVRLSPGSGGTYHSLPVAARPAVDPALQEETELTLSTVQLFDLTDAVDQFLADAQALPDLTVPVRSRPRTEVRSSEPVADRVLPPLLGVGALAAAAAGLFMLPIPEVPEFDPESIPRSTQPELEAPVTDLPGSDPPGSDPADGALDGATEVDPAAADAAETDSTDAVEPAPSEPALPDETIRSLQTQLETQLAEGLADVDTVRAADVPLVYQVSVAENGDIVGYQAVDQSALDAVDQTPLPDLSYRQVGDAEPDTAARFIVQFEPEGTLTVEPAAGAVTDVLESGVESETDEALSE